MAAISEWLKSVWTGRVSVGSMSDDAVIAELRNARKTNSRIATAFALGIPLLIVGYVWNMVSIARNLDENELVARLEQKVTTAIWPALSRELDRLATQVGPKLLESFGDALVQQGETIAQSLDRELSTLQTNLEKKPIEAQLALGEALSAKLTTLVANDFPEVDETTRKALAADAAHRLSSWTSQRMTAAVEEHVNVLTQIKQTLDNVKMPAGSGDQNLEDVLWLLLEVVNLKLDSTI